MLLVTSAVLATKIGGRDTRIAALEKRNGELSALSEGRYQIAMEARRELTALREATGVDSQGQRIVEGPHKPKPATWRDSRAAAANDTNLLEAQHVA